MGYRTLSGSRKHPELNSIPETLAKMVGVLFRKEF